MEDNTNNKKKKIRLLIIGLIVLLITIIGATYAYFSITGTNNSSSSVITNTFGESGNVTLTGSNTLHITLNATDMATNNKGNVYYATDVQSENYKTTSTSYEVAKAQVVGGDDSQSYSNCKFNLNVALSGDMANLLQEGDMKITFSGAYTGTYDLSNLSSPYEVTLSNLSGTNRTQSVNAVVEFNNLDKDQVYLAGKTLTITLTNTNFSCNGKTQPAYTIASGDLDTVGSEVCIGTECFYVIGKEGNNVKLLSKWNLKVGGVYNGSTLQSTYITSDTGYGLQDENMKGYVNRQNERYGTVAFSSTNYWNGDGYLELIDVFDNRNDIIKPYIDNYVAYLNTHGVTVRGRLIIVDELITLGCDLSENRCSGAPSWVYQTSYWSGSAYDVTEMWSVQTDSSIDFYNYSNDRYHGVRPVIIIEP